MGGPDRGVRTPPRASAPGTLHSSAPFLGRPPFVCGWVWVVWGPSRDPGWAGSDGHSRDTLPLRGGYPESGFHPLPGPAGTGEAGEPRRGTRGERAADSRRETGRRDGGEGERREQGRWSQEAKREGHWERKAENEMQKEKPSREGERRERMQRGKREGGRTTRARGRKDNASDRRQENKGRAEGAAAVGQTRGGPSLAQSPAPGGGCRVPGGRGPIRSPYLSFPFCFAPPLSCLCSLLRVGGWDWGSQTQYPLSPAPFLGATASLGDVPFAGRHLGGRPSIPQDQDREPGPQAVPVTPTPTHVHGAASSPAPGSGAPARSPLHSGASLRVRWWVGRELSPVW